MVIRSESKDGVSEEELFLPFANTQEVAAIYDASNGNNIYSYLPDPSGKHLSQKDTATSQTTYPFRSPRSDVLALVDQTGALEKTYAYEPFGETEEGYDNNGTPFLYQDDYLDQITSLYHMQARWYDPSTSLFTSTDPMMGDAQDPSLRSPYAYCADDPVYNSDPSGKSWEDLKNAMRIPFLARMIMKNRVFALAILSKKSGKGRSTWGGSRRAEAKSLKAAIFPEQVPLVGMIHTGPLGAMLNRDIEILLSNQYQKPEPIREGENPPQVPKTSNWVLQGFANYPIVGWFVSTAVNKPARQLNYFLDNVAWDMFYDKNGAGRQELRVVLAFVRGVGEQDAFIGATQEDYRKALVAMPEVQQAIFPGFTLKIVSEMTPPPLSKVEGAPGVNEITKILVKNLSGDYDYAHNW
jgi:RHS repeat-associated protein